MADKYIWDIPLISTMNDEDRFLIVVGTSEYLITKETLQKVLNNLSNENSKKLSAIIIDGDGKRFLRNDGTYVALNTMFDSEQFIEENGVVKLNEYHIHQNKNILDKFTIDTETNKLLYDGKGFASEYILPPATIETLGGIKPDGTTITVDNDGTIHGANTYELPIASSTVLGGVKIDGDTIKINDGIISADVIGNWSAGTVYPVGYFVVYDGKLYQCINANSDTEWTESNWTPIGSANGIGINNWSANTLYKVGNLIINETTLYQCNTEHTSGETFDETELANWTALSGVQGEKGTDGISPVANVASTDTGCTITITDSSGTTTTDLSNGITPHIDEATKHWFIGDVDTGIIAEGVTTISTTSVTYTGILSADGWVGDTAPYTQDIVINGITADSSPILDLVVSDDITTSDEEISQWAYITKAIITFRCNNTKPTIELNFKVKVV